MSSIRNNPTLLLRHLLLPSSSPIRPGFPRAALSTLSPSTPKYQHPRLWRRCSQYHSESVQARADPANDSATKPIISLSTRSFEIPALRSLLLRSPTAQDLEEQELDAELIPRDKINVLLTARAAEQLRRISTREGNPDTALRISVESGGCHGYQYKLGLANKRAPEDYHLSHPDIRPSNLYIDAVSLPMLNGSTVDYATELIGSSFRVTGNPQAKGGCGCGVSWELND